MLVIDTEVYPNYFLLSAKQIATGKVRHFEMFEGTPFDKKSVAAIMRSMITISFNGLNFDLPLIALAINGADCKKLKKIADKIIRSGFPAWKVCKDESIIIPSSWDHIDLIEVAPGRSSLKIYGGRMHAPKLQDLPIDPDETIQPAMRKLMREYCVNDLDTTEMLYRKLEKAIALRDDMSKQYGMDLRSKSDAQIAETVIKSELNHITGKEYKAPQLPENYSFRYTDPKIIKFKSPDLQAVFKKVLAERFTLGSSGAVIMPKWLKDNKLTIGGAQYQMGIGGLHSCESKQLVRAGRGYVLSDWDVASYYPSIILQQRLAPKSLGDPFLKVYQSLVTRRLNAKKAGNSVAADTLKIAVNGSFGKLGSKYSALFAPELLIQTTMTGQLALLMLIERMEAVGAKVVSANTDGIVIYHALSLQPDVEEVAWDWMLDTSYTLERTDYQAIASRDVNNYVAVKLDGETKGKGCFAKPGLQKNPDMLIVYEAVSDFIATGKPIAKTIAESRDVTKFCTVRMVKGGAVWRQQKIGKAVRFYYSTAVGAEECIHYVLNNNRVPNSSGAKPLMELPTFFPGDIDYHAYLVAAEKLICEIGAHNA